MTAKLFTDNQTLNSSKKNIILKLEKGNLIEKM